MFSIKQEHLQILRSWTNFQTWQMKQGWKYFQTISLNFIPEVLILKQILQTLSEKNSTFEARSKIFMKQQS